MSTLPVQLFFIGSTKFLSHTLILLLDLTHCFVVGLTWLTTKKEPQGRDHNNYSEGDTFAPRIVAGNILDVY